MCKNVKSLQGATVTVDEDAKGVLLSTWTPFSMQRWTLAHELGHILLGHKTTIDQQVGEWIGREPGINENPEESAADTFAAEILAPRRRIVGLMNRYQWKASDLRRPVIVYQLGLRLGISYLAACNTLRNQGLIEWPVQKALKEAEVKAIKRDLSTRPLGDPWADVWTLCEEDSGAFLEAGPNDLFIFDTLEDASSGYLWQNLETEAALKLAEQRGLPTDVIGAPVHRRMEISIEKLGSHVIHLVHHRPWSGERAGELRVTIENWGKETEGLCRRMRDEILSAAV
jgi:Zn-dependent peptidase ImmA (M78 family)